MDESRWTVLAWVMRSSRVENAIRSSEKSMKQPTDVQEWVGRAHFKTYGGSVLKKDLYTSRLVKDLLLVGFS